MRKVGSREIKNRFGRYLREAKAGGQVLITERGKLVATLTGKSDEKNADPFDEMLDLLEKQGLIRRGRGKLRDVKAIKSKGRPASRIIVESRD